MGLTDTQISEFIALYQHKCGVELERADALERATKLLLLVRAMIHKT